MNSKMSKRKFYKTIVPVEVLSESPIPQDMPVDNIIGEACTGDYSARELPWKITVLNGRQAAKALIQQHSDPGFFQLTDKGEDA